MAQLAEALLELKGLSLPNDKVQNIKALWNSLDPFDKKATEIILKSQVQLRGHLCSQKKIGHTTTEQMKRYYFHKIKVVIIHLPKVPAIWSLCSIVSIKEPHCRGTVHIAYYKTWPIKEDHWTTDASTMANLLCLLILTFTYIYIYIYT